MFKPMEKVSVAKSTLRRPSEKRISMVSLSTGNIPGQNWTKLEKKMRVND
jgi:hypothetical protein